MKKKYLQPYLKVLMLKQHAQILAGSGGPRSGDQNNPGMGGGSSRRYRSFDDDEGEEEDY
jgi:hypothetical protein